MGTRHLISVHTNGEYKVAKYCQWDGYPSGNGLSILYFLRNCDMDEFKAAIAECTFLTQADIDEMNKCIEQKRNENPGYIWSRDYPELSRDTSAEILEFICDGGVRKTIDDLKFAADSLFCEWAYVIDLDKGTFEVFEGFNKDPLAEEERFYPMEEFAKGGYHPVKFIKSFDLDNLPTEKEFLEHFKADDEE